MAGAGRIALAALLLVAVAACWVVATRPAPLRGTGPGALAARLLTPSEVSATPSSSPWGAFLRIWRALQLGDPGYVTRHSAIREPKLPGGADWVAIATRGGPALGLPQLVSEHRRGAVASIDYIVGYPELAVSMPAAVLPRSIELQRSGGAWLLDDPAALVPLLGHALR